MPHDPLDTARDVLREAFGHTDFRGLQAGVIGERPHISGGMKMQRTSWCMPSGLLHVFMRQACIRLSFEISRGRLGGTIAVPCAVVTIITDGGTGLIDLPA